jgi:tRNA(fMet)-specific endonuclease VapC
MEAAGIPIGDLDLMIASVALVHNQVLLTRDIGHFEKVPGLTVETW